MIYSIPQCEQARTKLFDIGTETCHNRWDKDTLDSTYFAAHNDSTITTSLLFLHHAIAHFSTGGIHWAAGWVGCAMHSIALACLAFVSFADEFPEAVEDDALV